MNWNEYKEVFEKFLVGLIIVVGSLTTGIYIAKLMVLFGYPSEYMALPAAIAWFILNGKVLQLVNYKNIGK